MKHNPFFDDVVMEINFGSGTTCCSSASFSAGIPAPYKPKIRIPASLDIYNETKRIVKQNKLHTVCEEASCPNIYECWNKKHASFMILGSVCTRKCSFCHIDTGKPNDVDPNEPLNVALAVKAMGLRHVVITSVDRDDLSDGGASHFVDTIQSIRLFCPDTTIEVLTPDFLNKDGALESVIAARPDVFNHNVETVSSLYRSVRPQAKYFHSLWLLRKVKEIDDSIFTKSGFMFGLGETDDQVKQLLDDLRAAKVDFITMGQYLQPTPKHAKLHRYLTDDDFSLWKKRAYKKGFLMVSASALTRSSYHADDDFIKLREQYNNRKAAS